MGLQFEERRHPARTRFQLVDAFAAAEGLQGSSPALNSEVQFDIVEYKSGSSWRTLRPTLRLVTQRNTAGDFVWLGRAEMSPDGVSKATATRSVTLRSVDYRVRVSSHASTYAPLILQRRGPSLIPIDGEEPVSMSPGAAYPFAGLQPLSPHDETSRHGEGPTLLKGTVKNSSGRGIAGVIVSTSVELLDGQEPLSPPTAHLIQSLPSDADGRWQIVFAGRGAGRFVVAKDKPVLVDLTFQFADKSLRVQGVRVVPGRQTSFQQAGLRGLIVDRRGMPIEGARVQLRADRTLETRSQSGGAWTIAFPVDQEQPDWRTRSSAPRSYTVVVLTESGERTEQIHSVEPGKNSLVPVIQVATSS